MIVSMTGFGDATRRPRRHALRRRASLAEYRFLSRSSTSGKPYRAGTEIESTLRERLGRGSITFILKMRMDGAEAAYHVNVRRFSIPGPVAAGERNSKAWRGFAPGQPASAPASPGAARRNRRDGHARRHDPALTGKAIEKLELMRAAKGNRFSSESDEHSSDRNELAEMLKRAPFRQSRNITRSFRFA